MKQQPRTKAFDRWEFLFQVGLHTVVFMLYILRYDRQTIEWVDVVYFLQYASAALVVSYFLLPRFLYKERYLGFGVSLSLLILAVMLHEEFVLEHIFYADTRGTNFPGFWITIAHILPLIAILTGGKFAFDALRQKRELDNLRLAVSESQLAYLQAQINPHYLFNNLNNIYSYAVVASPSTPQMILELAGTLRYMLYESRGKYVELSRELEQLQRVVNLGTMQLEERGVIEYRIKGDTGGWMIAPLLLNVFIENALKYGSSSQSRDIRIDIDAEVDADGVLHFHCVNSYSEEVNRDEINSGIGLSNVRQRLELLYPQAHQLECKGDGELFRVKLNLQLHAAEKV